MSVVTSALSSAFGARRSRPARYSAAGLIARGARDRPWPRVWREVPLRSTYDVVIIGGGVHGLATAYYLATNHGITNVAVLDKAYLGSGGSGPQHRHRAVELPHPRGRRLLRPLAGSSTRPCPPT